MLQLRRDLDLAEHLDRLGYDEFWCGEHHSTGWEMIASPELFLAAAGERTHHLRLGTGVVSLPYHHPFTVAQRMVQLDHQTRGRAIFGSGPGALPSDARMLGIDPMTQRDRQDQALGAILRLLAGETVTEQTEWYTLNEARLQILPLQERMPAAVASSISPSGMTLAGKYGIGVLSIASQSSEGLAALPTQWAFAEESAAKHGRTVDRRDWRVLMAWHLAETREQAIAEAAKGLQRWHNGYNVEVLGRPGAMPVDDAYELAEMVASGGGGANGVGAGIIGTPDDAIDRIRAIHDTCGGFGTVLGFAHDWANREATFRSWELFARYVMPELQGHLDAQKASAAWVSANKAELMAGASAAIMAKVLENPKAAEAMAITMNQIAAQRAAEGASAGE
jgi:limonene 1,2-monooxygenase